jgi:hypothetical protein
MRLGTWGKWLMKLWVAGFALQSSSRAFAQGCAMCYNNAAATRAGGQQALRSGILILMVPPVLMLLGIFAVAWRRRNKFDDALFESSGEATQDYSTAVGVPVEARERLRPRAMPASAAYSTPSEEAP